MMMMMMIVTDGMETDQVDIISTLPDTRTVILSLTCIFRVMFWCLSTNLNNYDLVLEFIDTSTDTPPNKFLVTALVVDHGSRQAVLSTVQLC